MSRYLLDTHVIYRWMRDDRRLASGIRRLLAQSDCTVSVASVWEMVLENIRGKLPLPQGSLADALQGQGFSVLAIGARHVEETRRFSGSIPDPFDRLLLATASEEGMLLLTQDAAILDAARKTRLPVAEVAE